MSATKIEWATHVLNAFTGCDRVSPGCAECYALTYAARLKTQEQARATKAIAAGKPQPVMRYQHDGASGSSGPGFGFTVHWDKLRNPPRLPAGARVFVNSMSDVFHASAPDEALDALWALFAQRPDVAWLVLTKRADRMRAYLNDRAASRAAGPLPNVWLGVSVENRRYLHRVDELRATPAAVRFASCEPLLGPLDGLDLEAIDWLIVGGESGGRAGRRLVDEHNSPRADRLAWVRDLRDACQRSGTAFFFKQWGGYRPTSGGRVVDGCTWSELPHAELATTTATRP
jgi:protein gp37